MGAPPPTLIRAMRRGGMTPHMFPVMCREAFNGFQRELSVAPPSDSPSSASASKRQRPVALAAPATARFVPSGVVHAKRCWRSSTACR